jgi:hypothetical protein
MMPDVLDGLLAQHHQWFLKRGVAAMPGLAA